MSFKEALIRIKLVQEETHLEPAIVQTIYKVRLFFWTLRKICGKAWVSVIN